MKRGTHLIAGLYSKEILDGKWDVSDTEQRLLNEHAEKYNINPKTFK